MKKIIFLFFALTMLAVISNTAPAPAASYGNYGFPLYSSASGTVRTSDGFSVRGYKTKTLTVTGATLASNAGSMTFKNMSGTVVVEESPSNTAAGPWTTAIANNYAQTAVSRTTNGTFTWSDAAAYIRLKWTGGTVGTKLKAWLNWQE